MVSLGPVDGITKASIMRTALDLGLDELERRSGLVAEPMQFRRPSRARRQSQRVAGAQRPNRSQRRAAAAEALPRSRSAGCVAMVGSDRRVDQSPHINEAELLRLGL